MTEYLESEFEKLISRLILHFIFGKKKLTPDFTTTFKHFLKKKGEAHNISIHGPSPFKACQI